MNIEKLKKNMVRFRQDESGQDLIEYALMAAFVAVAAGAVMPGIADSLRTIYAKVVANMNGTDPIAAATAIVANGELLATIRIICAVLAIAFLGVIVLRRNKSADE